MGDRIKELRKFLGLSQNEFGECIGVKQTTIAGYETGGREPLNPVVNEICRKFGVSELWLRTGEGEMLEARTRDEEISLYVGSVLADESAEFQRDIILAMKRTPPEDWEVIRRFVYNITKKEG